MSVVKISYIFTNIIIVIYYSNCNSFYIFILLDKISQKKSSTIKYNIFKYFLFYNFIFLFCSFFFSYECMKFENVIFFSNINLARVLIPVAQVIKLNGKQKN